jgi:hypothetical protein
MCKSRDNLGLDIFLDIRPWLALLGCMVRKELSEVARLNPRHHAALLYGIVVLDDCDMVSRGRGYSRLGNGGWSTNSRQLRRQRPL